MPSAKIFVSHSSDEATGTPDKPYYEALEAALAQNGYQLFIDNNNLRGSDPWRQVLLENIVDCHAAVVVISRKALASEWIKFELTQFVLRWNTSDFGLYLVAIEDLARRDVVGKLNLYPLNLGDVQFVQDNGPPQVAEDILALIGASKIGASVPSGFDLLALSVAQQLQKLAPYGCGEIATLRDCCEQIFLDGSDLDDLGWAYDDDADFKKSAQLLLSNFDKGRELLVKLHDLSTDKRSSGSIFSDICHYLAPMWISRKEADAFDQALREKNIRKRKVRLRAKEQNTPIAVYDRARSQKFRSDERRIITLELKEDELPLMEWVKHSVAEWSKSIDTAGRFTPQRVLDEMGNRAPVLIRFPQNMLLSESDLEELREQFKVPTFVLIGDSAPEGDGVQLDFVGDEDPPRESRAWDEFAILTMNTAG